MPSESTEETAKSIADTALKVGKDVLYVGVGAVVLAFQQLQVQRRELEKAIESHVGTGREQVESLTSSVKGTVDDQMRVLDERVNALEARIDAVLDQVQGRLPEQARDLVQQARDAAKTARQQMRERLVPAA